jgi:hypothetical protein
VDRNVDAIDHELERVTVVCEAIRRIGGTTSTALLDKLLGERRVATSNNPRRGGAGWSYNDR